MIAYTPKSNLEAWQNKFISNVKRDYKIMTYLANNNWKVLVVWECDLRYRTHDTLLGVSNSILYLNSNVSFYI